MIDDDYKLDDEGDIDESGLYINNNTDDDDEGGGEPDSLDSAPVDRETKEEDKKEAEKYMTEEEFWESMKQYDERIQFLPVKTFGEWINQ